MQIKVLACLPNVTIHPGTLSLDTSRIIHLSFSEWLELEGQTRSAAYDKLNSRYDHFPPVFLETTIHVDPNLIMNRAPENVMTLSTYIESELDIFMKALHWYTGTVPVHPMRSAIYFDPRSEENFAALPNLETDISEHGVQRRYGESEKEYATQNENPSIALRAIDGMPLRRMIVFVRQTQNVWAGEQYELVAQSLSLCSAPGLDWPSRVLLLVGAYESLFLPDSKTNLRKGFETRFSCMAATRFDEVSQYAAWAKFAYQLRSELIHGHRASRIMKKLPVLPSVFVEAVSRMGVLALCRLLYYRNAHPGVKVESDPLWPILDSAGRQAETFAALQNLIPAGSAAGISHQWQIVEQPC